VRLDHLLSKEHAGSVLPRVGGVGSRATARTRVPGWLLMGGTSTSWPVLLRVVLVLPGPAVCGGWGGTCRVVGRLGTLLGPEGTGARVGVVVSGGPSLRSNRLCLSSVSGLCGWCRGWVGVGAGCGGGFPFVA
jgi:hypothetical protein